MTSSLSRFLIPLLPASLALTSCINAPPSRIDELDEPVPESWAASKSAKAGIDHAWVDRFDDAKLEKLVDEAIANNPDLGAAAARIERAEAISRRTGADLQPQIEASVLGSRDKQNFIGLPLGGPDEGGESAIASSLSNRFGTSIDVTWELDVWGRVQAATSAAVADTQAATADYRAAQTSLAAQVSKAWFALIEANQQIDLANKSVEVFSSTENTIRERFELGQADEGGTGAQLRLAMSDTASARAELEQRKEEVARATRQLEILLGRYPEGDLTGLDELPDVPPPAPAGLPSELLQRRPDFLAAERRFASSGQRVKESKRAFFPRFAMTTSIGTTTDTLREILNSDFGVWSLAGNIAQPIWQGGRLRAERDVRIAEEKEALANLQDTVLKGFGEVEIALAIDRFLKARESALSEAVKLAYEAYQESVNDYSNGVGDFLTVLTAQRRTVTTRSAEITARRLRLDNRINLHLALGGDFRPVKP